MKRVMFLLACTAGIGGLVGEQQAESITNNVSPRSCKLNVAFLLVTFAYTSAEVHL